MKKLTTKFMAIIMVCLLVITTVPTGTLNAQAAAPKFQKKIQMRMYKQNAGYTYYFYVQNPTKKGKITNVKNSNSSVAETGVATDWKNRKCILTVEPKNVGKTKVSFKYGGKQFKTTITVEKWESPCKQFKIGNKDYAKKFEISDQYNLNKQKKDVTAKIKVTPKKGWKLLKIEYVLGKTIKNNSKVKLSGGGKYGTGTGIYAYFKNKKTGKKERLYFGFSSQNSPSKNIFNAVIN